MAHLSDSRAQRQAEAQLLTLFSETLKRQLQQTSEKAVTSFDLKKNLSLGGCSITDDGCFETDDTIILVEVFARTQTLAPGQVRKVNSDAFKLCYIADRLSETRAKRILKYIVFATNEAAESFRSSSKSWRAQALKFYGIEIFVPEVPDELLEQLKKVQLDQAEGMKIKRLNVRK